MERFPLGVEHGRVFAVFAVVMTAGGVWATTRDGKDAGRVGLPGGKLDPGEKPLAAVRRESAEEGLHLHGEGTLIHTALVEGRVVQWFRFEGATPLRDYKEAHRGLKPLVVPLAVIAGSGYGNEFLAFDADGYDAEGYDCFGVDRQGFDRHGLYTLE